jgi:hypothetical protein
MLQTAAFQQGHVLKNHFYVTKCNRQKVLTYKELQMDYCWNQQQWDSEREHETEPDYL